MKVRKYQWAGNIMPSDNTRVTRPPQDFTIQYKLKPGEHFFKDNRTGKVHVVSPQSTQVSQDKRTKKQRKADQAWAEKKKEQIRLQQAQEETAAVANAILERTMPSYYIEKATGEDLGMVGRLAADLVAPSAAIKGLQLLGKSAKYVGKGIDYLARMDMARYGYKPTTRYYFKPGYAGLNGIPIENGRIRVSNSDIAKEMEQRFGRKLTEEELDDIIGYASPRANIDANGNIVGMDFTKSELDYVNNNINRTLNYEKGVPTKTTRYLKQGEEPYELEELVENGQLKEGLGLEETYSGSRGEENFFNRKDDANTRASKYLGIKYGKKDRSSLGNVGEDNPHYRSGVILTTNGGQYSIDSFSHALKDLYRNLKQGRRYHRLNSSSDYVNANNFGQLNRYREEFSPEFIEMINKSNGQIPEGIRVGMNKSSGTLFFQRKSDGKVIGRLWHNTPEEMLQSSKVNDWITKINNEFNLGIKPARVVGNRIEWPNMYGVLYKKGGNLYDRTRLQIQK